MTEAIHLNLCLGGKGARQKKEVRFLVGKSPAPLLVGMDFLQELVPTTIDLKHGNASMQIGARTFTVPLVKTEDWRICTDAAVHLLEQSGEDAVETQFHQLESKEDMGVDQAVQVLQKLCTEYADVFGDPEQPARLPQVDLPSMIKPQFREIQPRGFNPHEEKQLLESVEKLKKLGVIEPSRSPHNMRNVLAPKANGEMRHCKFYSPEPYVGTVQLPASQVGGISRTCGSCEAEGIFCP